jgi:hypothetical protein
MREGANDIYFHLAGKAKMQKAHTYDQFCGQLRLIALMQRIG